MSRRSWVQSPVWSLFCTLTAVWGVALATFWGCCRLGELTVLNLSSIDPTFNVTCSPGPILRTLTDRTHSVDVHVPWTKTTKECGADVVLTACSDDLCPCVAILNHFLVNNNIPPDQLLFSYKLPHDCYHPLTKQDFIKVAQLSYYQCINTDQSQ